MIRVFPEAKTPVAQEELIEPNPDIWVTAYLATWQHDAGTPYSNWGAIKTNEIDWDAFTHLIYFALNIGKDGKPSHSFNPEKRRNFNSDRLKAIVPAAHRNNTKILFSVGGSGNYEGFSSSITPQNRTQFIATIVELIEKYGFDGVDLDMEPIQKKDYTNFYQFVLSLDAEFTDVITRNGERPLITIAALKGESISKLYASVQQQVDQINIMTYDMAQAWSSWQAWHNSALYSEGVTFENTNKEMSSIEQKVNIALEAGIDRKKLGIGIDFYGYIWHTIHLLGKWESWPAENMSIMERSGGVPYSELYERYNLRESSWDERAKTSYLNSENPRAFVSFDNERSIQQKVQYAIDEGLGGVILWELGGGFLDNHHSGEKHPLLQAVKTVRQQYTIQQ
ncbi:MAG: glycoside hydrolase family 18 protein [Balneolaceae bacterium]